jgi:hypothetical protein
MTDRKRLSLDIPRQIPRRLFLRAAVLVGSGLIIPLVAGCDDVEGVSEATPRAATPTPTLPPATPQPTPEAAATPEPTPEPIATSAVAGAPHWRKVEVSGASPTPRRDHALVSDGSRLLLFGGRGEREYADLWSFDISSRQWEELPAGQGPSRRFGSNAVYDTTRGQMLVFGGQSGPDFFDETWAFDLARGEWTLISVASAPAQRYGSAGAVDPGGRFLISHGFTSQGRFDDLWALADTSWSDLSPAQGRPLQRCLMRGAWDATGGRFLMFGGQATGVPFLDDTWEFREGQGWRELTREPRPPARNFYAMAFDEETRRLILFGGSTSNGPANDLWSFDASIDAWSSVNPGGEVPSPRFGHDMVWARETRSLFVFGGRTSSQDLNDLWELELQP